MNAVLLLASLVSADPMVVADRPLVVVTGTGKVKSVEVRVGTVIVLAPWRVPVVPKYIGADLDYKVGKGVYGVLEHIGDCEKPATLEESNLTGGFTPAVYFVARHEGTTTVRLRLRNPLAGDEEPQFFQGYDVTYEVRVKEPESRK